MLNSLTNLGIFNLCYSLVISMVVLRSVAIQISPIYELLDEAQDLPLLGASRAGINLSNSTKKPNIVANSSFIKALLDDLLVRSNSSLTGPSLINTTQAPRKTGKIAHPEPSLDELERALLEPGVECGKVPIFENLYRRSINESFDPNAGNEDEGEVRILHGLDSQPGEWPWIVRIRKCNSVGEECVMCTGTLLNSRWVITAGHCKLKKAQLSEYKVTVGLYDLINPDERSYEMDIDRLIRHPDYEDLTNDLLLIRLARTVTFDDRVQPACFVHRTRNIHLFTKRRKCYTVGYGLTEGMNDAIRLQKMEITTMDPSECNSDQLGIVRLRQGTVCVGPPDNREGGSCKGDSGGGDYCYDPKRNRWVIFGTVSYGPAVCDREQGERWLTVSVDLSNFRTWILSTIFHNRH